MKKRPKLFLNTLIITALILWTLPQASFGYSYETYYTKIQYYLKAVKWVEKNISDEVKRDAIIDSITRHIMYLAAKANDFKYDVGIEIAKVKNKENGRINYRVMFSLSNVLQGKELPTVYNSEKTVNVTSIVMNEYQEFYDSLNKPLNSDGQDNSSSDQKNPAPPGDDGEGSEDSESDLDLDLELGLPEINWDKVYDLSPTDEEDPPPPPPPIVLAFGDEGLTFDDFDNWCISADAEKLKPLDGKYQYEICPGVIADAFVQYPVIDPIIPSGYGELVDDIIKRCRKIGDTYIFDLGDPGGFFVSGDVEYDRESEQFLISIGFGWIF